ncbi:uncharacterized protein UBRO2_01454 [Ustilago bromivora]|uniref:Uncharacterized protein n=1 Tax=Ustilago bromivora TaxID=307758 RepID=A0A8H8TR21_9BASI|nr:uncharacterized protein UBRO2_01454 [Ustilago bromivora]
MPSVFKKLRKPFSKSSSEGKSSKVRSSSTVSPLVSEPSSSSSGLTDHNPSRSESTTPDSLQDVSSRAQMFPSAISNTSPTGNDLQQQPSIDSASSAGLSGSSTKRRIVFPLNIAKQAVDQIVSRSFITVESIKVADLTPDGFHISLHIRIGKTGPAKAKISFPDGIDLYLKPSDTRSIANIKLSPIKIRNATRTTGLTVDGRLTASASSTSAGHKGLDALFRTLLSTNGDVILKVGSHTTEVKAYGMSFKRIWLEKKIVRHGLNHLGGVLSFGPSTSASTSQSLQRSSIQGFKLVGGDPKSGISFQAQVELVNPAQITVQLGDIRLRLQTDIDELRTKQGDQNAFIGEVILPNLTLQPGSTHLATRGNALVAPEGDSARTAGLTLIRYLLENRSVSINVVGSSSASNVPWVAALFTGLYARATLRNQLGPPLHIYALNVEAYQESEQDERDAGASPTNPDPIRLGDIRTPSDWPMLTLSPDNPIHASLPFSLSAGGSSYVRILKNEAKRKGIELNENLIAALQLMPVAEGQASQDPSQAVPAVSRSQKPSSHQALDLPNLIASALSSLKVSAHIVANVSIGDYRIPGAITFVQHQLPIAITVKTARNILPTIGAPLVDALIDQAKVSITKLKILDMDEKGLNVEADIGLVDFGPLDVEIHLDQGLSITSTSVHATEDGPPVIGRIVFGEPLRGITGSEGLIKTRLRILPASGPKSVANFATFVSELIHQEEFKIDISTDACRVVAGGAYFPAVLFKSVVLPGLGGLKGLALNGLDIFDEVAAPSGPGRGGALSSASASSGGSGHVALKEKAFKIRTRVRIPHKGLLAVGLSKIEAGVEFEDVQIGIITAEDIVFTLTQADVEFEAKGYIFIGSESLKEDQTIPEYRQTALQMFGRLASALLAGTPAELTIRGYRAFAMGELQHLTPSRSQVSPHLRSRSSTNSVQRTPSSTIQRKESMKLARNGSMSTSSSSTFTQKQVPWLDQAFQKVTIKTVLQQDLHPVIKGIQIKKIFANFLREQSMQADIDEISFQVEVPLAVRFEILSVQADIEVHFEGYGCVGTGWLDGDVQSCIPCEEANGDSSKMDESAKTCRLVRLAPGSFHLATKPAEGLGQLIAHIADCEETDKISISGKARARVDVALGEIYVDVDLGKHPHVLQMDGVRGLRSSPVQYRNLQVVEASSGYLKIVFSLYLNNPSKLFQFALPDTDMTMAAFYRGMYVGRAHIPKGFKLGTGPVAVHDIHFRYCPPLEAKQAVRDIPANFLSGRTTTLEIRGDDESSEIPLLVPALKSIKLSFALKPMMDRTLIDSISIALGVTALTASSVDAEFVVNNPLGVPFDLCAMSFMAYYKGQPFGSCTVKFEADRPLRVPAGSVKLPGRQKSAPVTVTLAQPLEDMVGAFLKSKGQLMLDLEVAAKVDSRIPNS